MPKEKQKNNYRTELLTLVSYLSFDYAMDTQKILDLIDKIPEFRFNKTKYYEASLIDHFIKYGAIEYFKEYRSMDVLQEVYKKYPKKEQLFVATCFGWDGVVTKLLAKGAKVNAQSSQGDTPLFLAIKYKQLKTAQALIDAGAEINAPLAKAQTHLSRAITKGQLDVVMLLVRNGADINAQLESGETPLALAIKKGRLKIVNALIKAGAGVNVQLASNETPLMLAVNQGHLDIVNALIAAGADVNAHSVTGETPLHLAAQEGHLAMVKALYAAKAEVNPKSILLDLIKQNKDEALAARIKGGMSPSLLSPLGAATLGKHHEVMTYLVSHGAHMGQFSAFAQALQSFSYKATTALKNGSPHFYNFTNTYTPLHIAAANNDVKALAIFVNGSADITHTAVFAAKEQFFCSSNPIHFASTALHVAAGAGSVDAAKFLIKRGANIHQIACDRLPSARADSKDIGMMPIHLAARAGHVEMVNLLLDEGAQINFKARAPYHDNSYGIKKSPLAFALEGLDSKGNIAVAKNLIEYGANLTQWSDYMQKASEYNAVEIMAMLLDRKGNIKRNLSSHLETATIFNRLPAVTLLIKHGVKVTDEQVQRAQDSGYDELYQVLNQARKQELAAKGTTRPGFFKRIFSSELSGEDDFNDGISDVRRLHHRY